MLDGVYCHTCWLFADRHNSSFNAAWTTGKLNDWQGISKKILKHELSHSHLNACLLHSTWKDQKTVDCFLEEDTKRIKQVLKRIIDITLTLAISNLPYRGHRENITADKNRLQPDSSQGVFLNIVKLLARYDPILELHINRIKKNEHNYLSNKSQNNYISLISQEVLKSIVQDIRDSPFFTLIVDTTQDVSKTDQLSLVIRYTQIKKKKIEVQESFLGFYEMKKQGAEDFEEKIIGVLDKYEIGLDKCRGQGYDGAATMSGKLEISFSTWT